MKLLILTQKIDMSDDNLGSFHGWLFDFAKKFENVTVICLEKSKYQLPPNVEIFSLGKESGKNKLKYLFNFYKYICKKKDDYEAVFVHMNPEYVVLGGWLWRMWGKKIGLWYTHKTITWKLRLAEKFVDIIFTASRESCRLSSSKIMVVGHGIDIDKFRPGQKRENGKIRIITAGRISPAKGLDVLIDAAFFLKSKKENFEFLVAGSPILRADFEYFSELRKKISRLGLKDNISFVGSLAFSKMEDFYRTGNVFVNLSSTGSIDKAVLEAMACGLPVLTSNEAFGRILPKEFIFSPGDSQELAKKAVSLKDWSGNSLRNIVVKDHNLQNLIGKISAVLKEDFSSENVRKFYDSENRLKYESERWFSSPVSRSGFEMTRDYVLWIVEKGGNNFRNYLELGPGSGIWTELFIEKNPAAFFDLVDISEKMLDAARARLGGRALVKIKYIKSDFDDFSGEKKYDLFFSSRAFEYLPDKGAAVKKISNLLELGGKGFIITKNPRYFFYRLKRQKIPVLHQGQVSPGRFRELLKLNGFSEIKIFPVSITVPVFGSAVLNALFYRFFRRRQMGFLGRIFCEAYGVEFVKR